MISDSELFRLEAMSQVEKRLKAQGFCRIAGVDEAGRGPLAGPVVVAACILPGNALFENLNDSKQLTAPERERLFTQISSCSSYALAVIDVAAIDRINILRATLLGMQRAVESLPQAPDYILVDGNQMPLFSIAAEPIVRGDSLSVSIAAASILAKVTRDRMMEAADGDWPMYGFKQHKGYATQQHLEAIQKFGPCPIHRRSFDPIKSMLAPPPIQQELL